MKVLIVALRRSGTTAFWSQFRQDRRFRCFNEPFNEGLVNVSDPAWRDMKMHLEYRALLEQDPRLFWERYAPIGLLDELHTGLSRRQADYLSWLLGMGSHVCVDVTRCHFKLQDIAHIVKDKDAKDVVVVHLYRPANNFCTSVMLPGTGLLQRNKNPWFRELQKARMRLRNRVTRRSFWTTRRVYPAFGYGPLIGATPRTLFAQRLAEAGLDPERIYNYRAVGKLLAYWKMAHHRVETDGPRYFPDRFLSINFNDFCHDPAGVIGRIYALAGEQMPALDHSRIHPPNPAHDAGNRQWDRYYEELGIHLPPR